MEVHAFQGMAGLMVGCDIQEGPRMLGQGLNLNWRCHKWGVIRAFEAGSGTIHLCSNVLKGGWERKNSGGSNTGWEADVERASR